jgi:non-specific serine/threonine protein kinase/serine/threonine-protein kinase
MSPDPGWTRMWEVFHAAAELPLAGRAAYLAGACGSDRELAGRVQDLLAAHDRAGDFLEPVPAQPPAAPERIGGYRVRERLGEGGFAEVWLADQLEPVQRRVAIKVLKLGMDSRAVLARFEAERQTLALLEHPGVATVFDAGLHEGRPFVVMELIPGPPITRYCDERRLSIDARLELFVQVCSAVQHAHHKGVIHRDLKPANVLVMEVDGRPQVKVIDFGIAKAIDAGTRGGLRTEEGLRVGTPEYMSPEQVAGADFDTRADVYALGVLLHELLVGTRPDAATAATPEPQRPSACLATAAGNERTAIAAARRATHTTALARRVRGDLDWIVLKALATDRTRRYASPAELAADVVRHQRCEPVLAGPPSAGYRLAKFARRHRALVAGCVLAVLTAAAWVVHLVATARREERLRVAAEQATATATLAQQAEAAARAAAEKGERAAAESARVAQAVTRFFAREVLAGADPRAAPDPDVPVRQVLDAAAALVEERFAEEPLIEAAIRQTLGDTYRSLGLHTRGLPHLERATELFAQQCGEDDARAQGAANELAVLYERLGRFDDAERRHRRLAAIRARTLGPEHHQTLLSAVNLGAVFRTAGRLVDAEQILAETLPVLRRVLGEHHEHAVIALHHLAGVYVSLRQPAKAEPLLREVVAKTEAARGPDHPYTIAAWGELAEALGQLRRYPEAETALQRVLDGTLRRVGEAHPDAAIARAKLGVLYGQLRKWDRAEPLLRAAAERLEAEFGADHPTSINARHQLGLAADHSGLHELAEPHLGAAAERARRVLTANDVNVGHYLVSHGKCLRKLGRTAAAEAALRAGHEVIARLLGPRHARTHESLAEVVLLLDATGRKAEADVERTKLKAMVEGAAR